MPIFQENRFIQPTVVGICMYDTCKAINQEIVDPQSRSNFEQRMQDMRKSKFRNSQTVDEWERTLRGETQKINEHFVKEMDNHVEKFDGKWKVNILILTIIYFRMRRCLLQEYP